MIKLEQGMALDILGVIDLKPLSLSNYSLTKQLLLINFFAALIGLITIILINSFLIRFDNSIDIKINETKERLQSTTIFLENNSIVRIPLFKNCRINNLIDKSCYLNTELDKRIMLSGLELEPTSSQQYIIQNFLDSDINISIYNNNMIEIINSSTLFIGNKNSSAVKVLEITENQAVQKKPINSYLNFYTNIFNIVYSKLIRDKYTDDIVKKKHDIKIFKETNQKRRLINYKFIDKENNIIHLSSAPIIKNNKVYGIAIASLLIEEKNNILAYTSFILFNFYIFFILITIFLSLFFVRGLILPIKQLSNLTLLERQKIRTVKNLSYPKRDDEIGILSNQIQKMSVDLKSQISQLEKFSTDVAHELKNPLTGIKSSSELLLKENISDQNKNKILKHFNKEVDRMNKLISDITNFSKTISEIESEKYEIVNLNEFLENFTANYLGNRKKIKIIFKKNKNLLYVLLNKNKFLQVIINLIENSISMSKSNTKILITVKKIKGDLLELKIYDQGKGVILSDKEKIFKRFYTDREENREAHSGLGLSISREIINSFNGSLELTKSDNLDFRGACFMIKLPLREY